MLRKNALLLLLPAALFASDPVAAGEVASLETRLERRTGPLPSEPARAAALSPLPPLPAGIEELKFADFFRTPVGPLGLEISGRLRALDGKRVRILGFMVKEQVSRCEPVAPPVPGKRAIPFWLEATVPGRMLLTATPQTVSMAHYGLADDLPPQTLYVTVPDRFGEPVPYTPGLMLLTGILSVGPKTEADGRQSIARLALDLPAASQAPLAHSPSATPSKP